MCKKKKEQVSSNRLKVRPAIASKWSPLPSFSEGEKQKRTKYMRRQLIRAHTSKVERPEEIARTHEGRKSGEMTAIVA